MKSLSAWFFGDIPEKHLAWIDGQPTTPPAPLPPPSEMATKFAEVIEKSGERWAFEDDQGHAHSYDLGITVSLKGDAIFQGSQDHHVYHAPGELFRVRPGSADANCIRDALKARRVRYAQELVERKQREEEVARVAREKRATEALEKLARGETLEDPFYRSAGRTFLSTSNSRASSLSSPLNGQRYF